MGRLDRSVLLLVGIADLRVSHGAFDEIGYAFGGIGASLLMFDAGCRHILLSLYGGRDRDD